MICVKEFDFDAAHYLPDYHGKCERLHGHTYKLVVQVEGTPDAEGMIIDFIELKKKVQDLAISKLDHSCLNDLLTQPSAENIAIWVWQQIEKPLQGENYKLYEVQVWETKTSGIIYRG